MTPMPTLPDTSIRALLPVKPVELLVLSMLAGGERHGYGIRQDILDHTNGAIALEAGNLYRTIRRLEADGWVDESERRPAAAADDERRRYYRLTPFGRRVLAAELERLRGLVQLGIDHRVIGAQPT
jgi:DNA-binding PadR family transcriptional regulator